MHSFLTHGMPNFLSSEEVAGYMAAFGVGIATAWKFFMRGRSEHRSDRAGVAEQQGYAVIVREMQQRVERLTAVCDRQDDELRDVNIKLDDEIVKRRAVESENFSLRMRVLHLENEVRRLGGTVS
jgi:hypothetical protein